MSALRRVIGAPWFVVGLWVAHVVFAAVFGLLIELIASTGAERFRPLPGSRDAFAIAELMADQPAIAGALVGGLGFAAIGSALLWTVLSPLVIARLDRRRPPAELGAIWLRTLPKVAVTSLWHLLLRGAIWFLVAAVATPLPRPIVLLVLVVAGTVTTLALDIARVHVVLFDAPGYHPRTALYAFAAIIRRPKLYATTAALWVLQICAALAVAYLGARGMGDNGLLIAARLAALGVLGLGLLRIALVIDAGEVRLRAKDDDEGEEETTGGARADA